jgi:hypothetical protein
MNFNNITPQNNSENNAQRDLSSIFDINTINYFTLRNIKNFNDNSISQSLKKSIYNVYQALDNSDIGHLLRFVSEKNKNKLFNEYEIMTINTELPKQFLEKFAILVIKRKIRVKIVCNYIEHFYKTGYDLDRCAYSDLCNIIDELFVKNPEYNKRNINVLFRSILREYWEDLGFQTYSDYKESFKHIIDNANYRYFNKY